MDSSRTLIGFLDIDHYPYDGKIMKACRLTSPPDRRTFDRRLANMSIDIKERILTIGKMFVKEEFVDPYIVSEGTTSLKAKGHLGNTIKSDKTHARKLIKQNINLKMETQIMPQPQLIN